MVCAKCTAIFGLCIVKSDSCLIFEMYKGKPGGPMYYQTYGPTDARRHLFNCAWWCIEVEICKTAVWEQGVCAQVGLVGTGQWVTGNVFIPKRPSDLPGDLALIQSPRDIYSELLYNLWEWITFLAISRGLRGLLYVLSTVALLVLRQCHGWCKRQCSNPRVVAF